MRSPPWHACPKTPPPTYRDHRGSTSDPTDQPAPVQPATLAHSTLPTSHPHGSNSHPDQHAPSTCSGQNHSQEIPHAEPLGHLLDLKANELATQQSPGLARWTVLAHHLHQLAPSHRIVESNAPGR